MVGNYINSKTLYENNSKKRKENYCFVYIIYYYYILDWYIHT